MVWQSGEMQKLAVDFAEVEEGLQQRIEMLKDDVEKAEAETLKFKQALKRAGADRSDAEERGKIGKEALNEIRSQMDELSEQLQNEKDNAAGYSPSPERFIFLRMRCWCRCARKTARRARKAASRRRTAG